MMKRPLSLALLSAVTLLAACGKHADAPSAAASAQAQPANSYAWNLRAAGKFEKADIGKKKAFVCALPDTQTTTAFASDSSIGFRMVTPREVEVSATTPAQALALVATAANRPHFSTGCYSAVSAQEQPSSLDPAGVYANFGINPQAYLWAQRAVLQPDDQSSKALAEALSPAYSQTSDVIQKQAILKQARPQVDALIATDKAKPYVDQLAYISANHLDQKSATFSAHLDFDPSATMLAAAGPDAINYSLNGPAAELTLHPASAQVAQAFEAFVSRHGNFVARLHMKFVGTGQIGLIPTVEAWVISYDILDAKQKVVFTVNSKGALSAA